MLSEQQIQYELDYWLESTREQNDARQKRLLDLWGFRGAPSVLEIGTGPYGGCLPQIESGDKVAADPLFLQFEAAGLYVRSLDWVALPICIEAMEKWPEQCDAVLCANTLDHGDSDWSAVDIVARLLKPGGRFYLHVNLRTPEQLNEGHNHVLQYSDLEEAIQKAGLCRIRSEKYDYDPVEYADYETVIGIFEKPYAG
ncbi:MAG: hypothetical protein A2Z18_11040 [Armatimonadetes bacterium RBG_16_58_9]|nr:MAG: hypothetical protein A2Z18_11040 [Armatimonadetes bacterium RBG_16_58_9]